MLLRHYQSVDSNSVYINYNKSVNFTLRANFYAILHVLLLHSSRNETTISVNNHFILIKNLNKWPYIQTETSF